MISNHTHICCKINRTISSRLDARKGQKHNSRTWGQVTVLAPMVGNQKNVGSREPSFSGVITSSLSFPKLVHGQEQVTFCPELPELPVFGFDDSLCGGYLYAAPHGSLVEIIPGGVLLY